MTIEVRYLPIEDFLWACRVRVLYRRKAIIITEPVTILPEGRMSKNLNDPEYLRSHLKMRYPQLYKEMFDGRHIRHTRRWNRWRTSTKTKE